MPTLRPGTGPQAQSHPRLRFSNGHIVRLYPFLHAPSVANALFCSRTISSATFQPARSLSFSASPIPRTLFAPTRTIFSTTTTASVRPSPTSLLQSTSGDARTFSTTAALGARRSTYNPSRLVQKRRHGFLNRLRSRGGRGVLSRRRTKGRKNLTW